ncbi:hypothetical protein GCM10022204_13480 [Microlunatus aurantiacus]|uniref:Uncharacterized protein n=1 Tax=Microlunatus aurantiacus TaxID=446786 RepID=A0ABP7D418_9ACTN
MRVVSRLGLRFAASCLALCYAAHDPRTPRWPAYNLAPYFGQSEASYYEAVTAVALTYFLVFPVNVGRGSDTKYLKGVLASHGIEVTQ